MRPGSVHTVFFSATGTTRKVMTALSGAFSGTAVMHELLYTPLEGELLLGPEDLLLAGAPVYKPVAPVSLKPSADESCTLCGICVNVCPAGALGRQQEEAKSEMRQATSERDTLLKQMNDEE